MNSEKFKALSAHDQALVCVAVLLDGREAAVYLDNDKASGAGIKRAALDVAGLDPELRMALLGTMLRTALSQIES